MGGKWPPTGGKVAEPVELPPTGGKVAEPVELPTTGGKVAEPVKTKAVPLKVIDTKAGLVDLSTVEKWLKAHGYLDKGEYKPVAALYPYMPLAKKRKGQPLPNEITNSSYRSVVPHQDVIRSYKVSESVNALRDFMALGDSYVNTITESSKINYLKRNLRRLFRRAA
jgi:hypothetical protein